MFMSPALTLCLTKASEISLIIEVDDIVGRLVQTLKDTGQAENTLYGERKHTLQKNAAKVSAKAAPCGH